MHRLQTIVLAVWVVFVLLLAIFNWSLLWREEPVEFLFVEFEMSLFLGLALLGVNTMHVEDRLVGRMIDDSSFRLRRRYYQPHQTEPDGPYSQVYVLEHGGDCP